jgi:hypothetical protein
MRNQSFSKGFSAAFGVAMLAAAFVACRPRPPESPPAPVPPAPEVAAPMDVSVQSLDMPPAAPPVLTAVTPARTSGAQSKAAATLTSVPELSAMKLAAAGSKLGVPVDLRYSFDGGFEPGRPATLHLAAVPRVAGTNLSVSIKDDPGIQLVTAGPFGAQKATVATAYRQLLSVTKLAGGPTELRVLVTMEVGEGSAFGWFSVPLEPAAALPAQK